MAALEKSEAITGEIMEAAIAAANYFRESTELILEGFGQDDLVVMEEEIRKVLERTQATKREVQQRARMKRNGEWVPAQEFNRAWDNMLKAEEIRLVNAGGQDLYALSGDQRAS